MFARTPGFLKSLQLQLEKVSFETIQSIDRDNGLRLQSLLRMLTNPQDYSVDDPVVVHQDDVAKYEDIEKDIFDLGLKAIEDGQVAYCILSGGNFDSLKKLPDLNISLLAMKIMQSVPSRHVWIMTDPANDEEIKSHLSSLAFKGEIKTFKQYQTIGLTPDNLLCLRNQQPYLSSCGHGDVVPALKESGLLHDFIKQGGKYICVVNASNVLASLDPLLIGWHIKNAKPITCEVVEKIPTDSGGILCSVDGVNQIVEEFRIFGKYDPIQFNWLNTNSMIVDANLDFNTIKWSWHRVKKNVHGNLVVHYERLLQDLTYTFQTSFVEIPRHTRFLPIKNSEDLKKAAKLLNGN